MIHSFACISSPSLRLELQTATALCTIVDSPRSLAVYLLLVNSEWQQYLDLTIDADSYDSASNFADDYLVTEVLRKSPNLPLGIDRPDVALRSFMSSEAQCEETNTRLCGEAQPEWIYSFERHLATILGPLPKNDLRKVAESFRFGPGASTGVPGVGSTPSDKYDEEIHLTENLIPFFRCILGETWWEHQNNPQTVIEWNRFTTVPKSAKTDRGICVEPTLNMYVQLGIGKLIRGKLKRAGIDLDLQDRNRDLAKRAYSENLATIDLSAASDSMSWALIVRYFPERWVELLILARADHTKLPSGDLVRLEKFSSMGNGFTFELETLVFYAVCLTFIPKDDLEQCVVYGDDIIVPTRYAVLVIDALEFLGFRVNTSKSFLAGNFFESCGTDWFKGQNVRPFYLKGGSEEIPYTLQIANQLRIYARRRYDDHFCDARFRQLWISLYERTPRAWRVCKVPMHFGDVGFIVSRREAYTHAPRVTDGHEGYWCRHMAAKPVKRRKETIGFLLSILASRVPPEYSFPSKGLSTIRGYLGALRTRRSNCHSWTDGLEWL